MEHIAPADQADLVLVAPATANAPGCSAHGLADDMLTTTVLACDCPKIAAPAMNTRMYENPLPRITWPSCGGTAEIVEPASGRPAPGRGREDAGRRSCWRRCSRPPMPRTWRD